jgi:hypothetical protein
MTRKMKSHSAQVLQEPKASRQQDRKFLPLIISIEWSDNTMAILHCTTITTHRVINCHVWLNLVAMVALFLLLLHEHLINKNEGEHTT